jgi:putative membrane protein insertion efficiency factor
MTHVRRAFWLVGTPVRAFLIGGIHLYRLTLSSALGNQCRFYPSCSHYAEDAIKLHGAAKGTGLAVWRILRCGPFTKGGVDHVPQRRQGASMYDTVAQSAAHR